MGIDSMTHAVRTTKNPTGPLGAEKSSGTATIADFLESINSSIFRIDLPKNVHMDISHSVKPRIDGYTNLHSEGLTVDSLGRELSEQQQ